jgi:hypothetical protein
VAAHAALPLPAAGSRRCHQQNLIALVLQDVRQVYGNGRAMKKLLWRALLLSLATFFYYDQ